MIMHVSIRLQAPYNFTCRRCILLFLCIHTAQVDCNGKGKISVQKAKGAATGAFSQVQTVAAFGGQDYEKSM